MKRWIIATAIAGFLLGTAGAAQPAAAQAGAARPMQDRQDRIRRIQSELADLDVKIEETDRLSRQLDEVKARDGEEGILAQDRASARLIVLSRDQLIERVTEQIYRDGTGIGAQVDTDKIVPNLRKFVEASKKLKEGLRQAREDYAKERDKLQREIAELRESIVRDRPDTAASPTGNKAQTCAKLQAQAEQLFETFDFDPNTPWNEAEAQRLAAEYHQLGCG